MSTLSGHAGTKVPTPGSKYFSEVFYSINKILTNNNTNKDSKSVERV